jgi:(S)-2-hydroxyglutarate dehydrogenase
VATDRAELPRLDALFERGVANGLTGLERVPAESIPEIEPEARGLAAIHVPQTGIVDFREVSAALARVVESRGGEIRRATRAVGCVADSSALRVLTTRGDLAARLVIGCAGLQADRLARACGLDPGVAIVPFRGEYYEIAAARRTLVRHLIYPVPDPAFPFLGVHFTRRIDGTREAGPNAVLAFAREGYRWSTVSRRDMRELIGFPGFWRLGRRYWRMGLDESVRSFSKRRFVTALQRLVPALEMADLVPGGAGVRAQAVTREGNLVDDFHLVEGPRMLHVLNAPSPAATASLAIGRHIAELALAKL